MPEPNRPDLYGLYNLDVTGAVAMRACGGNLQSEHESCVTLAVIPGTADAFLLGDTKRPGVHLRFTREELDAAGIDPARFGLSA